MNDHDMTEKSGAEPAYKDYIGVFVSGVGGISVLHDLKRELPQENFLYYGDSANAPYGEKPIEKIRTLTMNSVDYLVSQGVKALVIACNTATSAAIPAIREKYEAAMPVIGVEPAIKPAAEAFPHGRILVMATPATLKLDKYTKLSKELAWEAEFVPVACTGLAGRIEKGNFDAPDMNALLEKLLGQYRGKVDAVVLGCTHYPFIRKQIQKVMGDIPLFDGGAGTARQLRRQLLNRGLLREGPQGVAGKCVLKSSLDTDAEIKLYHEMLQCIS
jgi:glutamate racemase